MDQSQSESDSTIRSWFEDVLSSEAAAIQATAARPNPGVISAVREIASCQGRLIVTGMGKMGCIARKAAGTFSSTGTPAIFLDPADAVHGGLGVVAPEDVALAISNSGETEELLNLLPYFLRNQVPVIALTGKPNSSLARQANIVIDASVHAEADPDSLAPTNSSTVALACCDGLAVTLMRLRGFTKEQFAIFHPGGHLGRKLLLKLRDLMHVGDRIPIVESSQTLGEAITVISKKKIGAVLVQRSDRLCGVLTDGDVRRVFESTANSTTNPLLEPVATFMTPSPASIEVDALAAVALNFMEQRQITVLPVIENENKIVGIIHLHDLIRSGLV
jgi:arabinose-5-phosphate isomerase